jgi:V/A-type H+-transporting ATPase subunit F
MRVLVIADPATCLAFSLDGIDTRPVKTPEGALAALESARNDREIGLILITERTARSVRPEVDKIVFTLHRPLLVEIPDTAGPLADRASTSELMVSLMGR